MPVSDLDNDIQLEFFSNMGESALIQSDFTEGLSFAEGIQTIAAGAGAGIFNPPLGVNDGHPGIWALRTGSTATGRTFILSRVNTYVVGVGGITKYVTWLQLPILSTPVERFTARAGFLSVLLPNVLSKGIGFEYDELINGGRWQAITNDGAETSNDTGVLVTAGTWYKLEFTVNADGTEVTFFIDDVLVATNITDIPSGIGIDQLFVNMHIMKLIGTTPRDLYVDAYAVYQETGGRQ